MCRELGEGSRGEHAARRWPEIIEHRHSENQPQIQQAAAQVMLPFTRRRLSNEQRPGLGSSARLAHTPAFFVMALSFSGPPT